MPDTADPAELNINAVARLLATDMLEELLAIVREIFARNAFAERLAYSPDEAAELLGISRELVHALHPIVSGSTPGRRKCGVL